MDDFVVVSAAWLLNQQVTTYDDAGNVVPDDGQYQRHGAEIVYVFAEFMQAKGLLKDDVDDSRRADLELRFSQLTDQGQKFARFALHKWMRALDRAGPNKPIDSSGLERRWSKFAVS